MVSCVRRRISTKGCKPLRKNDGRTSRGSDKLPGLDPNAITFLLFILSFFITFVSIKTIGPFNTAGTFHLYCTVHQGMNLTVIVQ